MRRLGFESPAEKSRKIPATGPPPWDFQQDGATSLQQESEKESQRPLHEIAETPKNYFIKVVEIFQ